MLPAPYTVPFPLLFIHTFIFLFSVVRCFGRHPIVEYPPQKVREHYVTRLVNELKTVHIGSYLTNELLGTSMKTALLLLLPTKPT